MFLESTFNDCHRVEAWRILRVCCRDVGNVLVVKSAVKIPLREIENLN